MKELQTHIIILIAGVVVGTVFGFAICGVVLSEQSTAVTTLDAVIDEWCGSSSFSVVSGTQDDSLTLAGIPARKELPDARPHYFPDTVRSLATWVEQTYHIPHGVTLAQWALESNWGRLNLNSSNYFGHTYLAVKLFMPVQKFMWAREQKVVNGKTILGDSVRFANYQNIRECFLTHGNYLHRSIRYKKAFEQSSPYDFARELASAGYATDPNYGLKLTTIIKRYHLE